MNRPIIVIPTYNERSNIRLLLEHLFALGVEGLQVIVVDDNSPDKTAEVVSDLSKTHPITLIKRAGKLGLGSAYIEGFTKALSLGATHIFEMDADLSHDPDDIPRLLAATTNADLVIGSRKIPGGKITGWGWMRKAMSPPSLFFSLLLLFLPSLYVPSGFRCFQARVLQTIPLHHIRSNGYAFQEELLYRTQQAGFTIKEIPVTFTDRANGQSKLSKKDIAEFFLVMIKLRLS